MSQITDTPTTPTANAVAPPPEHRTPKVFKAAAWVAIVAGVVFIISVIFFTGFRLGMMSGGHGHHGHHHKHHPAMMHRGGYPNGGPGAVNPGGGPGGPSQVPPSVAPSTAPSPTPGR